MARHPVVLTATLAALLSCASPTEPIHPDDAYPPGIFLGTASEEMFEDASTPPTVRVRPGRLIVLGIARSPNSCYGTGTGEVTTVGSEITISVTVTHSGAGGCLTVISGVAYRASVDVPPGTYTVRLRHELTPSVEIYALAVDTVVVIP